MCSKIHEGIGVFIGSLGLFWTKAYVGESLGSFLLYLFVCALILYMLARNAFILCIKFSGAKTSCLLSKGLFLVIRASGHCWASL
jgi:hypothetical protein